MLIRLDVNYKIYYYICFLNLYFEIMVQFHKFHVITYLKSMLLCLNIFLDFCFIHIYQSHILFHRQYVLVFYINHWHKNSYVRAQLSPYFEIKLVWGETVRARIVARPVTTCSATRLDTRHRLDNGGGGGGG